jgi:hypothetical protein
VGLRRLEAGSAARSFLSLPVRGHAAVDAVDGDAWIPPTGRPDRRFAQYLSSMALPSSRVMRWA